MDDPLAIEDLLDSLGVRLWGLVAVKVAARMAVELAAVQRNLLDQAEQHRAAETEFGNAVADRLEAMSRRLASDWTAIEESLGFPPLTNAKVRRGGTTTSGSPSGGLAGAKRSRGRPRKTTEQDNADQDGSPISSDTEREAVDP